MTTSPMIGNIIVYVVCILLNIAVVWQIGDGNADDIWQWYRGLPIWLQAIAGLLFLPWLLCIWVWQTGWAFPIRLILIVGLLGFVLYAFFPRGK